MTSTIRYDLGGETSTKSRHQPFGWTFYPSSDYAADLGDTGLVSSFALSEQLLRPQIFEANPHWFGYDSSDGTSTELAVTAVGAFQVAVNVRRHDHTRFDNLHFAKTLIYDLESRAKGRDAAIFIGYFVQRSFNQRRLAEVNDLLGSVSIERLTRWSMVALLRSTFATRGQLPAWRPLLKRVESKVHGAPDAERLLAGLKD
jgi:hypothetical protein